MTWLADCKHKWFLRDDGLYECGKCGVVSSKEKVSSLSVSLSQTPNIPHTQYSKEYLAGLIDGEGSFPVYNYTDKQGRCYENRRFTIANKNSEEFRKIIDYLGYKYGGSITLYKPKKREYFYLFWYLVKHESLMIFVDDFIPYLKIKKDDAIRLRERLELPTRVR